MFVMVMNCFCRMVDRRKALSLTSRPGPKSEFLINTNLRHNANRIWKCAELEFRLCWMRLCSSDNHWTTALLIFSLISHFSKNMLISFFFRNLRLFTKFCFSSKSLYYIVVNSFTFYQIFQVSGHLNLWNLSTATYFK